jgi:hypothetical protein
MLVDGLSGCTTSSNRPISLGRSVTPTSTNPASDRPRSTELTWSKLKIAGPSPKQDPEGPLFGASRATFAVSLGLLEIAVGRQPIADTLCTGRN